MTQTTARNILVTSALPYANGPIHLGHMLEYIQTDIWVRFQKLRGENCTYVCADDAHGTAIMLRAEREGITPEQLIDRVNKEHKADFDNFCAKLNAFIFITNDLFFCCSHFFMVSLFESIYTIYSRLNG